jgi:hypothetical protein
MRCKFLIFILLVYLPFYLPLRVVIPVNILFLQDIIIGLLLVCVIKNSKIIFQKSQNRIDVLMIIFLLYSLAMIFFLSTLRGGMPIVFKHFHNFIGGIFMYFSVRYLLVKKDFLVMLKLYICTAIIISILYIYEWINVNLLGNPIFSWVTDYNNDFGGGEQFLSKGSLGFYRAMGVIGYNHATGIFISGALSIVYTKFQQNIGKFNILIMILFFIAIILTASRTAILSLFIIFLVNFSRKNLRYKLKIFSKAVLVFSVIFFVYVTYIKSNEITMLFNLLSGSFTSSEGSSSIFEVFSDVFFRDIEQFNRIYTNYPIALLIGTGFPVYASGVILNPIITNDTYFIMWITQYGLVGSLIMLMCLLLVFKRLSSALKSDNLSIIDRVITLSMYRVLLIYLFSTIHSSSIQFYSIYFGFFAFLGIASYMTSYVLIRKP